MVGVGGRCTKETEKEQPAGQEGNQESAVQGQRGEECCRRKMWSTGGRNTAEKSGEVRTERDP